MVMRWRRRLSPLLYLAVVAGLVIVTISILGPSLVSRPARGQVNVTVNPPLRGVSTPAYNTSVLAWWTGSEQTAFGEVLRGFQQQRNINVSYQTSGDLLPVVLGNSVAARNPPDIALLPQPGLLTELAVRGELKPITDIAGAAAMANYAPFWRDLATVNGTLYGVYFKAANKSMVWYNVSLFHRAGIAKAPTSFAELLVDVDLLKQAGITPFSVCGASGWPLTDWFENVYIQTAGAGAYRKLTRHEIPWTDPSVTRALQQLQLIFGDPANLAGGFRGAQSSAYPDCVSQVFTGSHPAAMIFEGDFVGGAVQSLGLNLQAGTDYAFFPFPAVNSAAPPAVVVGGDVAVMLRDTPPARELLRYLAEPAAGEAWARRGGFVSPNRHVSLSTYPNQVAREAARAIVDPNSVLVFDMSDQTPAAFGATVGGGEWGAFQNWLGNPADIAGLQTELERDAVAAYAPGH